MTNTTLRKANLDDVRLVFRWRNLDEIVELSEHGDTVEWNEHQAWMSKVLVSENEKIMIIQHDGIDLGLLRLTKISDKCYISIYIVANNKSKGIGSTALRLARKKYLEFCYPVYARVKNTNLGSLQFFKRNGFVPDKDDGNMIVLVSNGIA